MLLTIFTPQPSIKRKNQSSEFPLDGPLDCAQRLKFQFGSTHNWWY
uniref:Uncharacterized protein n=1 Tax=Arundo donax TaxID=35708 RepID=A0A0A8YSP1_ARUDO